MFKEVHTLEDLKYVNFVVLIFRDADQCGKYYIDFDAMKLSPNKQYCALVTDVEKANEIHTKDSFYVVFKGDDNCMHRLWIPCDLCEKGLTVYAFRTPDEEAALNEQILDPSDLENICTLPLEIKTYRDALRKFTETHPDELPEDGFPIIPYTDAKVGPHAFICPSDWLGKVTKITWKSDGDDYHGIYKATVKCFPNQFIKFLEDASMMKHLKLIPVMTGSIIGDKTKEFNVHRLIGFMLTE